MRIFRFVSCKFLFNFFLRYFVFILTICDWVFAAIVAPSSLILPRYMDGSISLKFLIVYFACAICIIYSMINTWLMDPGYVNEESVNRYLQKFRIRDRPGMELCVICQKQRPTRAHHCKRCDKCVLTMDHHCPFVANCVGEGNRWIFMLLLFYSVGLGLSGLFFLFKEIFLLTPCSPLFCPPQYIIFQYRPVIIKIGVLVALFNTIFCGFLLYAQHQSVLWDRTTIEMKKAGDKYQQTGQAEGIVKKPVLSNYEDMCGYHQTPFLWVIPCRHRNKDLIDEESVLLSKFDV